MQQESVESNQEKKEVQSSIDIQSYLSSFNQITDSKIAYDSQNSKLISVENQSSSNSQSEGSKLIVFNKEGEKISEINLRNLFNQGENMSEVLNDQLSEDSDSKRQGIAQSFADTWSILRFVKNKNKGLEISSSGLTVKISKNTGGKHSGEELILTNMAFSSGIHLWEIIATISCNNLCNISHNYPQLSIEVGVYNPITKTEILNSFKTTTPRTITVCLDLNENQLKFWLNDKRQANKTVKIPPENGGPWIPYVKLEKEKNKIILNPFAREPSDFYEKDFDKKFSINKYLMPHLFNMICVTNLPKMSTITHEAALQLKEHLKLSSSNINYILMPQSQESSALAEGEMFCFIQFHYLETLFDFYNQNCNGKFKLYLPHQIASWFQLTEIPNEIKDQYQLIQSHVKIPKSTIDESLKHIDIAFERLTSKNNLSESSSISSNVYLTQQPFTDKLICIKDQQFVKIITRDNTTNQFDIAQANFNDAPQNLDSQISLKLQIKVVETLFKKMNWTQILKDQDQIVYGIVSNFFEKMIQHISKCEDYLIFRTPLNTSKFFLDIAIQQTRAQIDRIKRSQNNYQTIIPVNSIIVKNKVEQELDILKTYSFYEDHNHSVEELYMLLNILSDLQEQIWAQTRASTTPCNVKSFLNTVSRPYSALNRLGSFIQWGIKDLSPLQLSENGFFFRENNSVSQFENQLIEINDLSQQNLTDIEIQQELLGRNNRFMNSLVCENIPLSKSLNYLCPKRMYQQQLTHIIPAQNSEFVLIGGPKGFVNICNSMLQLSSLQTLNFFQNINAKRVQRYHDLEDKIKAQQIEFQKYYNIISKKGVPLNFLKNLKSKKTNQDLSDKFKDMQNKIKVHQELKKLHGKKTGQMKPPTNKKSKKKKTNKDQKKDFKEEIHAIDEKKEEEEEDEDVIIKVLFDEGQDANADNINKEELDQLKVLGFILLTKPYYLNDIDPILVGCVYYNEKTAKHYLKVKKLMFQLNFLQNFITADVNSGLSVNKLTGKQLVKMEDFKALYQEILSQRDVMIDLYSAFMRTQVLKKYWPKNDAKFQLLTDIIETEIEIPCSKIIDFTKCSYSIDNQDKIYFLLETLNEKQENVIKLQQFQIKEDITNMILSVPKVKIEAGQTVQLEKQFKRVFQFNDKLVLIGNECYHVLDQTNFNIESQRPINLQEQDLNKIAIINETESHLMFKRENIKNFGCLDKIPKQQWTMIVQGNNESLQKFPLIEIQIEEESELSKNKSEKISQFDLTKCQPNDILQIANLLKCQYQGTIAINNKFSYLTSSCLDHYSNLYSHHSWNILSNNFEGMIFEIKIPQRGASTHVRQLEIEFSFKKKLNDIIPIVKEIQSFNDIKDQSYQIIDTAKQLKRIPLLTEILIGAQVNDTVPSCNLIFPDKSIFSSNYPQPEFIFKHQHDQLFIPSQFIIRSQDNREFKGVPISQGIIFISESLEDLMNTKQFAKFTEKEYNQWKMQREKLQNIPLLTNEPIAFFNLEDKNEITIQVDIKRPCRFVKFIPTAFRKKPINFTSKPFNSNQAECQFFGINGYEIKSQQRGISENQSIFDQLNIEVLQTQLQATLKEQSLGVIGEIQNLSIKELRGAKSQNMNIPISSLQEKQIPNIIGVAKALIILKEEHCEDVQDISLQVSQANNPNWELQGVTIKVKSFIDNSVIFNDSTLQENKPKMRQYLLDPSKFQHLLQKLIDIAQDDSQQEGMRVSSLKCLVSFLRNITNDRNYSQFLQNYRQFTNINSLLNNSYFDGNQKLQSSINTYLETIGVLSQNSEIIGDFIQKQIDRLFEQVRPISNIESVFNLMLYCKPEQKTQFQQLLIDILFNIICKEQLPKYQSQEQILIRSKFSMDCYPFDHPQYNMILEEDQNSNKILQQDGLIQLLESRFEVYKINTLYQYNFDLMQQSLVQKLKLFFDQDNKNLYKICVRIIVPDNNGIEQLYLTRIFDENTYTQVCDAAHFQTNILYFNNQVSNEFNVQGDKSQVVDKNDLNCLTIDLNAYLGRYLKIQIELLDSYRTVHKVSQYTQIFIRPELYGQYIEKKGELQSQNFTSFKISQVDSSQFLGKNTYNNVEYSLYSIPSSPLSQLHKACLFIMQSKSSDLKINQTTSETEKDKLEEQQDELKELIREYFKKTEDKTRIQSKIQKINRLAEKGLQTTVQIDKKLTLRYLLNLADIICDHINPAALENKDPVQMYLTLFKHFIVFDLKEVHTKVVSLLDKIYLQIQDKNKLVSNIFIEFLTQPSKCYNERSIIQFILKQESINFNDFLINLLNYFGESTLLKQQINSSKQINTILEEKGLKSQEKLNYTLNGIVALLNILEDLKIEGTDQKINIGLYIKLISNYFDSDQFKSLSADKKLMIVEYCFKVLEKYLKYKEINNEKVFENCQYGVIALMQNTIQLNDKKVTKMLKNCLISLNKLDNDNTTLLCLISYLLQWYQNKENAIKFGYQLKDGIGQFLKHFSIILKIYVKILKNSKSGISLENTYQQLGDMMIDILQILTDDKDSDNYEENYSVVWEQIFQSLSYLDIQTLSKKHVFQDLAEKFFSLSHILQESIYPKLHNQCEKMIEISPNKDPSTLIQILKAFLFEGFKNNENIKITYSFCDGIMDIIQSGKKDTQNQTSCICYLSTFDISELINILAGYLEQHLYFGTYNGVTGSTIQMIMRLDIAVQIASVLVCATDKDKKQSFKEFVLSNGNKEEVVTKLIQWVFLNYVGQKGKSQPSGQKIYALSAKLEELLCQIKESEEAVSKCLPILMKSVITTDSQLIELIKNNTINYERSMIIQKTVNQLFLSFFKSWVQTDCIAKKFLLELNGFDFLLDRLFNKNDVIQNEEIKTQEEKNQLSEQIEDTDQIDDQIMELIREKLNKTNKIESPTKPDKDKQLKSAASQKIPLMKKQTAIMPEKPEGDELFPIDNTGKRKEKPQKDIEQSLQQDDFGRSMKIIYSSDKQKGITSMYPDTQWNKYKNGTKNKAYTYQINTPQHNYEYVVKFNLENVIQITELQVGVLYNWSTYDQDCQYVPQSFIVEGGKNLDQPEWKVELIPLDDDGYKMNTITVYGYNFVENKHKQSSLEQALSSIGCKECQYLTFRLRRPLMACLDGSMYIGCVSKIKSYAFSYISVMGVASQNQQIIPYLCDLQKENSLEILSKFFSGEFTEAFEIISQQPAIIDKIKNAFDKLSSLLESKASLIKPIFLAICQKNKSLGDWIMINRLLLLDEQSIKKEQIKFLGDIISSNQDKQLGKLNQLKDFIISQINLINKKEKTLNHEQQILLSRFIKLFNEKTREYAQLVQNEQNIEMQFSFEDLDNAVSLMAECEIGKSKLFNALTNFNLIFLIPPKPFINNTISIEEYMEKLLQSSLHQLQNLLFCSIIASVNETALNNIIKSDKVMWVIQQLKSLQSLNSTEGYQYAQILYNCTKQSKFRDQYRKTLTFELYDILKNNQAGSSKLLRDQISQDHISIIVQTIKDLVIGGETEEEQVTNQLQQDMIVASEKGDVNFINKVIVPILHAEERIPISISIYNENKPNKGILPIYQSGETPSKDSSFILKTDLLTQKQKEAFTKTFKEVSSDKVDNFSKLLEKKWELLYQDKNLQQNSSKFKKFVQSVENKQNVILIVNVNMNGTKAVFGGYSAKPFPVLGDTWTHEFDYQIPHSEGNFVFYYPPEKELHFTMLHSKPFGYIYTDYEEGGALSISGDFFLVSWSFEFQNSCGNIYDMKCLEEPSLPTFYNNMEILNFEAWWYNPYSKTSLDEGKVKSELKNHQYFQSFSPYNFFRENLVFEVSKDMNLSQAAKDIFGSNQIFIKYPEKTIIEGTETLNNLMKESASSILDLVVMKKDEKQEKEELKEEQKIEQGTKTIVKSSSQPELMNIQNIQQPITSNWGDFDNAYYGNTETWSATNILSPPIKNAWDEVVEKPTKIKEQEKEDHPKETKIEIPQFVPYQPILKKFEDKGGIFDLIKAAKAAVKLYNNAKIKEMWGLWLAEIESFSQLPSFFSTFCQNRDKETIIYDLLEGKYDTILFDDNNTEIKIQQQQEELHIEMVKYSYQIVNQVFEKHVGAELREQCLNNGTLERFIERIGQLTSEKKRKKVDKANILSETDSNASPSKPHKKSLDKEQDKTIKRKGVGYTTGVGTTWNVNEYLKSKEAKNAQISNIVNIIKHFIRSKDWEAPPQIKQLLLESAMLPTLEAALRSGSLLDMAKDFDLNMTYLDFIQELARHQNLLDLLLDIGDEYEPLQRGSIASLLVKLNDLSQIFLGCIKTDSKDTTDEQAIKPQKLAEKIVETNKIVREKVQEQETIKQQQSLQEILSMPLDEAYLMLLSQLRFEYMSMKDSSGGIYNHSYQADLTKNTNPPATKLVRLAQEIADLSNSLPCDHTNAIFCRVDKDRVDLMKCLIMGASGTPYAHGAFIYDLFFENSYPNTPPKCQLVTTGGQTVRFNPNLYHNGKVCLSLLGTWRGSATENWDPKLSTILQVLLSIQAIIMSNEVYFNEPGYEHEAGTHEGEQKNEGYANIVRYCNIKFAIIDAIKNPPAGFEKVIKRNFYLKKNEILREVKEWVDKAKTTDALYTGLVYDHNYQWAPQISQEGKYAEMIESIYKELKETLESIQSPFEDETTGVKLERKFSKQEEDTQQTEQIQGIKVDLNEIDMSYEPASQQERTMNIEDENVKDRWSRYIGAMGIEAVAKQAESRILISGIGPLGVEIAKNIVLAGCKELILHDNKTPCLQDLSGQFFLSEQDIGSQKSRAECCYQQIQQLNFYVKVTVLPMNTNLMEYLKQQSDIKVVVLADHIQHNHDDQEKVNKICREKNFMFISASQNGLFCKVFNDFGSEFVIMDKNGEELQEVMINDISNEEQGVVTLLQGYKHTFEDGDQVIVKDVKGMINGEESINATVHTIQVINPTSFKIGDTSKFSKYEGNGVAKQLKVPKTIKFESLEKCNELDEQGKIEQLFDQNFLIADFEKMENFRFAHICYQGLKKIQSFSLTIKDFSENCIKAPQDLNEDQVKRLKRYASIFWYTVLSSIAPLSAYLGGIVSQEIVKSITQKYTPINQFMYFDAIELFPNMETVNDETIMNKNFELHEENIKYQSIIKCLGNNMFKNIRECNLFMIGAGAIGCELLKNYAMLGLGTADKCQIVLTDPDVIEVSNLNRQFLFREKHLRKPKSQTAAAAAIQMNPDLKDHISARLDKIHDGTAHIYNEAFFQQQTIVTNALDNVQARLYIDNKCVAARVPLIDSGTLGPKGHVQVILPFQTESYSSQRDPEDNNQIPHCTLKMFPEETLHCVELAKDIFGKLFTLNPQSYNKLIIDEANKQVNLYDQQELTIIKKVIKLIEKQPKSFDDCIRIARERFQKHFYNDIKQLLHVYPIDKVNKDGRPFWSLPKRPPKPVEYDHTNINHVSFIAAMSCLLAKQFNIGIPYEKPRSKEAKLDIAQKASTYKMPEFIANDQKASEIESKVEKDQISKQQQEEEKQEQPTQQHDVAVIKNKYEELVKPLQQESKSEKKKLTVEEFEKDNDSNFHIDFISAMANIRASNYNLDEMDWLTVKIKAGRIVPALATTTAAIAGLQTLELLKYLKGCKKSEMRNSFLNLAVPSLMMSEPGDPIKTKIKEDLEVTLWDRWEYIIGTKDTTLREILEFFEKKFNLESRDIFYDSVPLFMHALQSGNKEALTTSLWSHLIEKQPNNKDFMDLTITFVDPETNKDEILTGIPPIRVYFESHWTKLD